MDVVQKLFDEARAANLGEIEGINLSPADIAKLLTDPVVQLRLRQEFARLNDDDVRNLVLACLDRAAERLDDEAGEAEDRIETLQWTRGFGAEILPIVGGGALIAAVIASGGVLGASVLLCLSIAALIGGGVTRHKFKADLRKARAGADRMRRLIAEVRK